MRFRGKYLPCVQLPAGVDGHIGALNVVKKRCDLFCWGSTARGVSAERGRQLLGDGAKVISCSRQLYCSLKMEAGQEMSSSKTLKPLLI